MSSAFFDFCIGHEGKGKNELGQDLRDFLSTQEGPGQQMLFEHDQERSLIEAIEDALHRDQDVEFLEVVHPLSDLMYSRVLGETNVLLEIADSYLFRRQDENAVAESHT